MAKDGDLLKSIKNQVECAVSANEANMSLFNNCQKFVFTKEGQWSTKESSYYALHNKPSLIGNRLYVNYKRTVGAQRNLKRNAQLSMLEGFPQSQQKRDAIQKQIDLRRSILESIAYHSKSNKIYEEAFANSWFGWGAWRIKIDYENDKSFYQSIKIVPVLPNLVYWDPNATDDLKVEGQYMGYWVHLTREEIKAQYKVDLSAEKYKSMLYTQSEGKFNWIINSGTDMERYVVCHHYRKKPITKKIVELSNDFEVKVVDYEGYEEKLKEINEEVQQESQLSGQPPQLFKKTDERVVDTFELEEIIFCGKKIFKKKKCLCKSFPICIVFSDNYINERGIFTTIPQSYFGQDIQKMNNVVLSALADAISRYRTERIVGSKENIYSDQDIQEQWANPAEYEGLMYWKPSTAFPAPHVLNNKEISQSLLATIPMVNTLLTDVIGRSPSTQMDPSNTSGRAVDNIIREDNQIDLLNYDNLNRTIEYSCRVINECIPYVYDSYRSINIKTSNGNKNMYINDPDDESTHILDEQQYEIEVKVGPAYEVQKQQTTDAIMQLVQANPQILSLTADLLAKNLNVNDAEEIAKRLLFMLDPRVLAEIGAKLPQLPPPQPPVNPMEMQQMQLEQQKLGLEAQKMKMQNQNQQQQLNLQAQKMQMDYENDQTNNQLEILKLHNQHQDSQLKAASDAMKSKAEIVKAVESTHAAVHTEHIKASVARSKNSKNHKE